MNIAKKDEIKGKKLKPLNVFYKILTLKDEYGVSFKLKDLLLKNIRGS